MTGLVWSRHANPVEFPLTGQEALDFVADLNRQAWLGRSDWRLPNISELDALVDCSRRDPALPVGYPCGHIRQAYWSATTSMVEPDWALALYTQSGAVGVGQKSGCHFHVWAVRNSRA